MEWDPHLKREALLRERQALRERLRRVEARIHELLAAPAAGPRARRRRRPAFRGGPRPVRAA